MLESIQNSNMPRPTPKKQAARHNSSEPVQLEVVDPIWLLKGIGVAILAALLCGYLTLCLLFYQGQWQLVLHPARTASSPSSIAGIPYQLIHFGPDESAVPQLTGWWIPAAPNARYSYAAILFLPGADGSLADSIPTMAALHNIGINVFAFDYRGYGQSAPIHPSQQSMTHDAATAWQYLTVSRAIPPQQMVPYGFNVGASLATHLVTDHPVIPALILDSPHADLLAAVQRDPRSHLIPVRSLFHERFPLAQPLSTLHTPKLLLSPSPSTEKAFQTAADPRIIATFTSPTEASYPQSITSFLDRYLLRDTTQHIVPLPAPAP